MQVLPVGQKVRIVEVGAGSGGTSVVVLEALAGLGERVEYVYTDISPQLIAYGRRTYGPRYPFAVFRLLDVEKDVEPQASTAVHYTAHAAKCFTGCESWH
jgi:hypothetical protein